MQSRSIRPFNSEYESWAPELKPAAPSVTERGPESSLADLDQLARALHRGFMHARVAGELLIQAKAKAGHGKWLPWLRDECEISERTASLYMRLAKNRGGIDDQIGNAVADLTLRGAMKLLSPPRQSNPHAEEMAESSAGTAAARAVDPMAIEDESEIWEAKRRRCALNADGPSIPSIENPSPADLALSAEPLRRTDGDGKYEAFKSRSGALSSEVAEKGGESSSMPGSSFPLVMALRCGSLVRPIFGRSAGESRAVSISSSCLRPA
jgi:Protein of unknown function (DUF3102)